MAGAIGNTLDRIRSGYVIDFIHVHHWPIFNVADALIVAGGLLLALGMRKGLRRGLEGGLPDVIAAGLDPSLTSRSADGSSRGGHPPPAP